MAEHTIGYNSFPEDFDLNDDMATAIRKAIAHNQKIYRHYEEGAERINKNMFDFLQKITNYNRSLEQWNLLLRQLNQAKIICYRAAKQQIDSGVTINGQENNIQSVFDKLILVYKEAQQEINGMITTVELQIKKLEQPIKKNNKNAYRKPELTDYFTIDDEKLKQELLKYLKEKYIKPAPQLIFCVLAALHELGYFRQPTTINQTHLANALTAFFDRKYLPQNIQTSVENYFSKNQPLEKKILKQLELIETYLNTN